MKLDHHNRSFALIVKMAMFGQKKQVVCLNLGAAEYPTISKCSMIELCHASNTIILSACSSAFNKANLIKMPTLLPKDFDIDVSQKSPKLFRWGFGGP